MINMKQFVWILCLAFLQGSLCAPKQKVAPNSPRFTCPENGFFAVSYCSSNYYNCVNGHAYLETCPEGTFFNDGQKMCDDPANFFCGFTCPSENGFYPSGICSSVFYNCVNGHAYNDTCPEGTLFDGANKKCDDPASIGCGTTTSSTAFPLTTIVPDGFCQDVTGFFAIPGECSGRYINCVNDYPFLETCPEDFIFNPATLHCDDPSRVDCYTGPTKSTTTSTTTKSPTSPLPPFECPDANGFFAMDGVECSRQYYSCIGGVPYIETCSSDAIFNPSTLECDRPEDVDCQSTFVCPTSEGTYPSPTDCSDYYVCLAGKAIVQHCPSGLYYNAAIAACDWPDNVICNVKQAKPVSNLTKRVKNLGLQGTEIGLDPTYNCPAQGVFPHPLCRQYYLCDAVVAHVYLCPFDHLFDLRYNGCNYPGQTDCQDRTRPEDVSTTKITPTTTTEAVTSAPQFTCPSNGFWPINACSSGYWICVDGEAFANTCPADTVFDSENKACSSRENVVGCITTTTTTTTAAPPYICLEDGFQAAGNCTTYYWICLEGKPYLENCPAGSIYDSEKRVCAYLENVANCQFQCSSNGFFPVGECISKYWVCVGGEATMQQCPGSSVFDGVSGACETPDNIKCPAPAEETTAAAAVTATAAPLTTQKSNESFKCPSSSGYYSAPDSCSSYYVCQAWNPTRMECQAGLYYNEAIGTCDWPRNVPCNVK